jgi:hypothetical protein
MNHTPTTPTHPPLQVPNAPPDGVIVHRKYRDEGDVLVYDVRCRASTRQAQVREGLGARLGPDRASLTINP